MMKPHTTPQPGTATTTAIRIDERAHRPAGLVLPGGSAKLQMNMRIHVRQLNEAYNANIEQYKRLKGFK